eukprot:Clim_evm103s25 gene=Clim_evmTU103s25
MDHRTGLENALEALSLGRNLSSHKQVIDPGLEIMAELLQKDIEERMELMDSLYNTQFCDWVQDQDNYDTVLTNLQTILREDAIDIETVAKGLVFITRGWTVGNIVALLRQTTCHWQLQRLTDFLTLFFAGVSLTDKERNDAVAVFVADMDGALGSHIVQRVVSSWEVDSVVQLLNPLSIVWEQGTLRSFSRQYVTMLQGRVCEEKIATMRNLKTLYETKMALAELKLSVARYNVTLAQYSSPRDSPRSNTTEGDSINSDCLDDLEDLEQFECGDTGTERTERGRLALRRLTSVGGESSVGEE